MFATCSRAIRIFTNRKSRNHSTTSNPFPFPTHLNPTPHQIFHLPPSASKADIRARYIDLVRIYHPDKTGNSLPPEAAHARFQLITAAYDALHEKNSLLASPLAASTFPSAESHRAAAAAHYARLRTEKLYSGSDDRWKDRIILASVVATVVMLVSQTFTMRKQALAEAVARSRHVHPETPYDEDRQTPISINALPPDHSDRRLSGS